jgi:V8-like Glu-specific endopeptidase
MPGIPSVLVSSLRQLLLNCNEFHSSRQLYAVFSHDELRPFQTSLPEAQSVAERVDLVIAYLSDQYRSTDENALWLLLKILAEKYDLEDDRHNRLVTLANSIEWLNKLSRKSESSIREANPQSSEMLSIAEAEKMLSLARSVARIEVPRYRQSKPNGKSTGTGWLIAPGLMITCWHVLEALGPYEPEVDAQDLQYQIENLLITFDFTLAGKGVQYKAASLEYPKHGGSPMDYTLLRLVDRSDAPIKSREYLALDLDAPLTTSTQLYIVQHPLGQPQQFAGDHFVREIPETGRLFYRTPTEPGTSGAPVFNRVNWRVVAIHNGENENHHLREGTSMKAILGDLEKGHSDLCKEILREQHLVKL